MYWKSNASLISCYLFGMGSEGKSPQQCTNGRKKTTENGSLWSPAKVDLTKLKATMTGEACYLALLGAWGKSFKG